MSVFLLALALSSTHDIVVYGATSGGLAAAIQSARMGKSVVVLDPGTHVGGLTTGGLSWTDIGNKQAIGGIAREFYQRIKTKYAPDSAWVHESRDDYYNKRKSANIAGEDAMWTFEPKVATAVYREMLAEHKVELIMKARLDLRGSRGVRMKNGRIEAIVLEDGRVFSGKMFIDATYEGDLMAKAKVSYTIGREGNAAYGEKYNGVQAAHRHQHQFPDGALVSPYLKPGDPKSGLLPIINPKGPGVEGAGDKLIQAYCFRMCLTNAPANRLPIEKPAGYDERDHELLLRFAETGKYHKPSSKYDPLPNAKTDTNNHGAVSTDYMGANYGYPEGDYATRDKIIKRHEVYQKGYMWTLQNHPRVPEELRAYYRQWGLPKDEWLENGHWAPQLYIREARRLVGAIVMTEHHITARETVDDSVGMGAYGMDSHNVQRYVTKEGWVRNEGNVQVGGFSPYPISYRALIPKKGQAANLLVPVCLSASHIAYGSIRMEPVFMVMGQSAATAAALAIDAGTDVHGIDYAKLRTRLLADKQVLTLPGRPRAAALPKLDGVVLDDRQAKLTGDWAVSRATPPYLEDGYQHDGAKGDGSCAAEFAVAVPKAGAYRVKLLYPALENRASNALVKVNGQELRINQKEPSVWLGPFDLPERFTVRVENKSTDGYVVVDGVQVVPAALALR